MSRDPLVEALELVHERPGSAQALALVALATDVRNVRDRLDRIADAVDAREDERRGVRLPGGA